MELRPTDSDTYLQQLMALLPRGTVWKPAVGSVLHNMLAAMSDEMARVHNHLLHWMDETDPLTTQEMLNDFERVLGLPAKCITESQSVVQRKQAVIGALNKVGGQSAAYFIALAKSIGYEITIDEFKMFTTGSTVGEALYNEPWTHTWRVNAPLVTRVPFLVGQSVVGDALNGWSNQALECLLSHYKPAQTNLIFAYDGQITYPVLMAGQSLIYNYFGAVGDGDNGAEAFQKALEGYLPTYSTPVVNGATGGTYAASTSNLAWPSKWWWDVANNQPGAVLLNCYDKVVESGYTPACILWGQGEADSSRVADDSPVLEDYSTWMMRNGCVVTAIGDGIYSATDSDGGDYEYFDDSTTLAAGELSTIDVLLKKRSGAEQLAADSFPQFKITIGSVAPYIVINPELGTIERSGGLIHSSNVSDFNADFWRVQLVAQAATSGTARQKIYPAATDSGTGFSGGNTGTISIRAVSGVVPTVPYSGRSQIKSAILSIWGDMRSKFGDIPVFVQRDPARREPTAESQWGNVGGSQMIRDIYSELIAENDWVHEGAEIYNVPLQDVVHPQHPEGYIIAGKRNARAIAAKLGAAVAWRGALFTGCTTVGDSQIWLDVALENNSDYAASMAHDASGVSDQTPAVGKRSPVAVFVDDVEMLPVSVTHYNSTHATHSNQLLVQLASGAIPAGAKLRVYYMHDVGAVKQPDGSYEWLDVDKIITDTNDLPARHCYFSRDESGTWTKVN